MADPIFCACGTGVSCRPAPTDFAIDPRWTTGNTCYMTFTPTGSLNDIYDLSLVPTSGATLLYPNVISPITPTGFVPNMTYTPTLSTRCLGGNANSITIAPFVAHTPAMAFSTQPAPRILSQGNTTGYMNVRITGGTGPWAFQWRLNGNNISGGSAGSGGLDTLWFSGLLSEAGDYDVIATDILGETKTSTIATLTVNAVAGIMAVTTQPLATQTLNVGNSYEIGFAFSGGIEPFTFQLMKGGVNQTGIGQSQVSNFRTGGIMAQTSLMSEAGTYKYSITDSSPTPQVIYTNDAIVILNNVFRITGQPQGSTINSGSTASMITYIVGGIAPYKYVLKKAGAVLQTSLFISQNYNNFNLLNTTGADAGSYTIEVTDSSPTPQTLITNAAVVVINAVAVRAYYQSASTNALLSESAILALPLHADFSHNATPVIADWTATTGVPKWLQLYIRAAETLPTAWLENNNPINSGAIGVSETFKLLGTVTATDGLGNWNVISSTEATDFGNTVSFSH